MHLHTVCSYLHLYAGQEVCINTPHTPTTVCMYNTYLHLYAGQDMYKYTTYTYIQYVQFILTLTVYAGQGLYKYKSTIHTYKYMRVRFE